jgi:hypothetical protein
MSVGTGRGKLSLGRFAGRLGPLSGSLSCRWVPEVKPDLLDRGPQERGRSVAPSIAGAGVRREAPALSTFACLRVLARARTWHWSAVLAPSTCSPEHRSAQKKSDGDPSAPAAVAPQQGSLAFACHRFAPFRPGARLMISISLESPTTSSPRLVGANRRAASFRAYRVRSSRRASVSRRTPASGGARCNQRARAPAREC